MSCQCAVKILTIFDLIHIINIYVVSIIKRHVDTYHVVQRA